MLDSSIDLAAYALRGALLFGGIAATFIFFISLISKILKKPSPSKEHTASIPPQKSQKKQPTEPEVVTETTVESLVQKTVEEIDPSTKESLLHTEEEVSACVVEEKTTQMITTPRKIIILRELETNSNKRIEFVLRDTLNVGRNPDINDWILGDDTVSSKHCKLYIEDNKVYIMDLNSMNGTIINGQLIKNPTLLKTDDTIRMGAPKYHITIED